jgi:hypothetical protein
LKMAASTTKLKLVKNRPSSIETLRSRYLGTF